MTEFTFALMILGMPGIICFFLTQKLIGKPHRTTIEIILLVFVYSALSYFLVSLVEACINMVFKGFFTTDTIDIFIKNPSHLPVSIMVYGILAGIILGYALSYGVHYNIVNWIGNKIKATRRYGDEDVWHFFHNVPDADKNDGWLMVRDLKTNLSYHCYISTWSDSDRDRELILSDASVFTNDTGEYLYNARHIYLSRNKDDLIIEVPPDNAETLSEYKLNNKLEGTYE